MWKRTFSRGDWVVYREPKCTLRPGPRAKSVHPAARGDHYYYSVEKFWIVDEIRNNGELVLVTRKGKKRVKTATDPQLRRASFWDRIRYRERFISAARIGRSANEAGTATCVGR